ncbi:hypothetical protein HYFRA_00001245 [Hymenoscyphus fraxineus]|uniref:Uncharacterized protein n=1 Tax=Hymenoscyphus fraxineus TaxID=746836 RepID=A0A9N9KTP6_9HELO|nr:hypothetical protein HYFRA_00001245 [Hymenoscyphus fraxineus]
MGLLRRFSSKLLGRPQKTAEQQQTNLSSTSNPEPSSFSQGQGLTNQESSSSSSSPLQEFTTPFLADTQLLDSDPCPNPEDLLALLDEISSKHPNLLRRNTPLKLEIQVAQDRSLERQLTSNTPSKDMPSSSSSSSPDPESEPAGDSSKKQEEEEEDDNASIITNASWIIDAYDDLFQSSFAPSANTSSIHASAEDTDPLFERGEPQFIFPVPEGSRVVATYLANSGFLSPSEKKEEGESEEKAKGVGEDVGGEGKGEDGMVILENARGDRVGLAAFATAVMFGGIWVLEKRYQ